MFVGDRSDTSNYRTLIFQAVFIGTVFLQTAENTGAYFSLGSMLYLYGHFANSDATH